MSTEILEFVKDLGISGIALFLMYKLYDKTLDAIGTLRAAITENTKVLVAIKQKLDEM